MKSPKLSEKWLLDGIADLARELRHKQRAMEIGQLIALIRGQLRMSQRALAKRANVPQSTISHIESGRLQPNVSTLHKLLNSMECDVLISAIPRAGLEATRRAQAQAKAKKTIQYLEGTMSLEAQRPDQGFLDDLINKKTQDLLNSSGTELWEDNF